MQVGDLIKCIDGGLYIVSIISEEAWRDTCKGEVTTGVIRYADLIDSATLETGAVTNPISGCSPQLWFFICIKSPTFMLRLSTQCATRLSFLR